MSNTRRISSLSVLLVFLGISGCGEPQAPSAPASAGVASRSEAGGPGSFPSESSPSAQDPVPSSPPSTDGPVIVIDGSSTVFPITEAVAELYEARRPDVSVRLGVSGTGGGFEKFCRRSTDISDASRPIKSSEKALCEEHGVELIELPVAFDGLSVVVHGDNTWSPCLTLEELRKLWKPSAAGRITRWDQVRAGWPRREIRLFGPGKDSGTFDYFTRAVVGEEGAGRDDFSASEDDYLLAQGVAREPNGLGFFGYAYYREYRDRLRLVAVDSGAGCVVPSEDSIAEGRYRPLSRPIFIYVRRDSLERPEVRELVDLYLDRAADIVREVGYVPLPERVYELARLRVEKPVLGSVFDGGSQVGMSIEALLAKETGN